MPAAGTAMLGRAIERALPERPFVIVLWDGRRIEAAGHKVPVAGNGGLPTICLHSPEALAHVLRAPGELGLARAYVLGHLDADDIDAVIALSGRWEPGPMSLGARSRLLAAALRAIGPRLPSRVPAAELRPRGRRHTIARDARAVRHHYDVSNEFFALFLDETMTYSCALFEREGASLEEAQRAKLELICAKLGLEPGMRLLDIGCGWGSLVIHAAREHGVEALGITLSEEQAELARERVRDAGVADRAEIRVLDYRELGDRRFDAIASIGMVEHVGGERIDEYAACIAAALEPDGKVLNHGIVRIAPERGRAYRGGAFLQRYVFPDGEMLPLSRMVAAFERAGLEALHVENLHTDYAETIRHWIARFEQRLEEAERIGGVERTRVWRLYLRAARNAFEVGRNAVCQLLCSHPLRESSRPTPTGGGREPVRRRVPVARG